MNMRKEIEDLAKTITCETSIEELAGKVESFEEIMFLLQSIKNQSNLKTNKLTNVLKIRALLELKDIPKEKLTVPKIQRIMSIGYPSAVAIHDWLCEDRQ